MGRWRLAGSDRLLDRPPDKHSPVDPARFAEKAQRTGDQSLRRIWVHNIKAPRGRKTVNDDRMVHHHRKIDHI